MNRRHSCCRSCVGGCQAPDPEGSLSWICQYQRVEASSGSRSVAHPNHLGSFDGLFEKETEDLACAIGSDSSIRMFVVCVASFSLRELLAASCGKWQGRAAARGVHSPAPPRQQRSGPAGELFLFFLQPPPLPSSMFSPPWRSFGPWRLTTCSDCTTAIWTASP